jgi:hypothetical protein
MRFHKKSFNQIFHAKGITKKIIFLTVSGPTESTEFILEPKKINSW